MPNCNPNSLPLAPLQYQFVLPPSQIVPVGKQVYAAVDALGKYIMAHNVPK